MPITLFDERAPLSHYRYAVDGDTVDSDTVDLTHTARGICLATASAVKVTLLGGSTVTFALNALAPGVVHPLAITRLWTTGTTTPAGIVLLW